MSTRDPQVDKVIEMYAMYEIPSSIFRIMSMDYGENCLSLREIKKIRENYRPQIVTRRKELAGKLPILDPQERLGYLQQIIDGALEGDLVVSKFGTYTKIDRTSALKALEQVQNMTQKQGVVDTDDNELIKAIVLEAFEEMKKSKDQPSDKEILDRMLEEFPANAKPYIEELQQEVLKENV